jgi:predicted tellurium resistance membrane protein TerC
MDWLTSPDIWVALLTLTALEIVLGIDNIVFSLDSVITAVGMAQHLWVMIVAVALAVGVMMFAAAPISTFVHRHPTVKMLALSFLLMIGVALIADGLGQHIRKAYIYFAMGFSVIVEMLNLRVRARSRPVELREAYTAEVPAPGS